MKYTIFISMLTLLKWGAFLIIYLLGNLITSNPYWPFEWLGWIIISWIILAIEIEIEPLKNIEP